MSLDKQVGKELFTAIAVERLKELERAEKKLHALEAAGVDNWEWYDDAMEGFSVEEEDDY